MKRTVSGLWRRAKRVATTKSGRFWNPKGGLNAINPFMNRKAFVLPVGFVRMTEFSPVVVGAPKARRPANEPHINPFYNVTNG